MKEIFEIIEQLPKDEQLLLLLGLLEETAADVAFLRLQYNDNYPQVAETIANEMRNGAIIKAKIKQLFKEIPNELYLQNIAQP